MHVLKRHVLRQSQIIEVDQDSDRETCLILTKISYKNKTYIMSHT